MYFLLFINKDTDIGKSIVRIIIPLLKFPLSLVGLSPANKAKLDLISVLKTRSKKMHNDVSNKGIPIIVSIFLIILELDILRTI